MKIQLKKSTKESNFKGKVKKIGIQNVGIISDLLRKHYAHPIRTLVQEYLSNARDAQREIKNNTDKIVVNLPTKISPILKIRDFGPGLSPKRINDVFCFLGNSTKRNNNNQTGGFGIGSKSAFAYRENFFVKSFYNGTETLYECSTAHHYEGTIEELSSKHTSEKNGVEIQIPVEQKDINNFVLAVYRASFFWTEKERPIIKGSDKYEYSSEFLSIDNLKFYKYQNSGLSKIFPNKTVLLVLDGIPYEIKNSKSRAFETTKYLTTLHFPTGVFKVAISRENIEETSEVLTKLQKELGQIKPKILKYFKEKFNENKTIEDKIKFIKSLENIFNISHVFNLGDLTIYNSSNSWGVRTNNENKISFLNDRNHRIDAIYLNDFLSKSLYLKDEDSVISDKKINYKFNIFMKVNNCSKELSEYIKKMNLTKSSTLENRKIDLSFDVLLNNRKHSVTTSSLLETSRNLLIFFTDKSKNVFSVKNLSKIGTVSELLNSEICNRIEMYSSLPIMLVDKKYEKEIKAVCSKKTNFITPTTVKEILGYCRITNDLAQSLLLREKLSISNLTEKNELLISLKKVYPEFYNKNLKQISMKLRKLSYSGTVSKKMFVFIKKYYKIDDKKSLAIINNITKFEQFSLKIKKNNLETYCLLMSFSEISRDRTLTKNEITKIQSKIKKTIDSLF